MKRVLIVLSALAMLICLGSCAQKKDGATEQETMAVPEYEFKEGMTVAEVAVKDYGVIVMELYPDVAPITVENFVKLAKSGFYDGLTFHRIMDGFMIQGGDPKGNGTGSSDPIKGEFYANGVENDVSHKRGVVSMARRGDSYDSGSCQFFIVHEDSEFLDGQYAAFGRVIAGMETVDAICEKAEPVDNNGTILSDEQPVILSVSIVQ